MSDATQLGIDDAQDENSTCSQGNVQANSLSILDFGQPYYDTSSKQYVMRDFSLQLLLTYANVEQATENYINGWLSKAGSCLVPTVVIGSNTSGMCGNDLNYNCLYYNGWDDEDAAI